MTKKIVQRFLRRNKFQVGGAGLANGLDFDSWQEWRLRTGSASRIDGFISANPGTEHGCAGSSGKNPERNASGLLRQHHKNRQGFNYISTTSRLITYEYTTHCATWWCVCFQDNADVCYPILSKTKGLKPVMPAGAMYMMVRQEQCRETRSFWKSCHGQWNNIVLGWHRHGQVQGHWEWRAIYVDACHRTIGVCSSSSKCMVN